jgi:hypothetical protein
MGRGNLTNMMVITNTYMESKNSTGPNEGYFEIHIKGHLDESWRDWLDGMEVKLLDNDEMILSGYVRDQAALMGTLNKIYGLNLTLLSVSKADHKE